MPKQEFSFIIENPKKKIHHLFAAFLFLVNISFLTIILANNTGQFISQHGSAVLIALLIDAFLTLLYFKAKRNFHFIFKADAVYLNDFPARKWNWSVFNNVILKDGLLTIDFKNNKIKQILLPRNYWEIEREFNEFCSTQLSKSA